MDVENLALTRVMGNDYGSVQSSQVLTHLDRTAFDISSHLVREAPYKSTGGHGLQVEKIVLQLRFDIISRAKYVASVHAILLVFRQDKFRFSPCSLHFPDFVLDFEFLDRLVDDIIYITSEAV